MARGWLGAAILAVFLIGGVVAAAEMSNAHLPTVELLEQASEMTINGEFGEGVLLGLEAKDRWEQRWNGTAAMADHSPMDEVDALFGELEVYAITGEQPHFAACCAELAKRIEAVAEAHKFSWWNIL